MVVIQQVLRADDHDKCFDENTDEKRKQTVTTDSHLQLLAVTLNCSSFIIIIIIIIIVHL